MCLPDPVQSDVDRVEFGFPMVQGSTGASCLAKSQVLLFRRIYGSAPRSLQPAVASVSSVRCSAAHGLVDMRLDISLGCAMARWRLDQCCNVQTYDLRCRQHCRSTGWPEPLSLHAATPVGYCKSTLVRFDFGSNCYKLTPMQLSRSTEDDSLSEFRALTGNGGSSLQVRDGQEPLFHCERYH